jgi:predicted aldo/keto reductase-like oxidoreductase
MNSSSMNRRSFLRLSSVAAAAATVGRATLARGAEAQTEAAPPNVAYRTLGRTGMKVSVIGYGAMRTSEAAVIRAAFDKGVNWLDTARGYMGGKNEGICGEALKGYRDRVYVTTKTHAHSKSEIFREAEESLRSLQTDHVDLYLLHSVDGAEELTNEEVREALAQLRQDGKVRFLGVSTHKPVEILDAVAQDKDKFFDVVLVPYNFKSPTALKEAIARAATAGVGIVAMKTQAGGYKTKELGDISPHQAALKWVLQDTNVTTAIPAMVDLQQVEEDTAVMAMMALTKVERQILSRYGAAIAPFYCIGCKECTPTCPRGVDIPTINRCLMYAEGYGDMELARATYVRLPVESSAAVCADCPECVADCPNGLPIAHKMRQATATLV